MIKNKRIAIVLPAYNAEKTLEQTYNEIPFDIVDDVILVDDNSKDNTIEKARQLGINHIIKHEVNKGYGGNQKSCYDIALSHGASIVIMLHPDYQYDPKLIKYFVEFIDDGYFDVMLGSRIRSRKEAILGGMPHYKYYANRFLSFIENLATGMALSEWHTGMRAYRKEVLESINYNKFSDDFVFDTQVLFEIIKKGYRIGDIPVPVRYFKEASSINLARSINYGFLTVWETIKFIFRR